MKNKFYYFLLLSLWTMTSINTLYAQAGASLNFDGTNDNCQGTRRISTDFTIELWIKTTTVSGAGTQWYDGRGLVDSQLSAVNDDFGISILGTKAAFGVGNYNGTDVTIKSTSNVTTGNWVHIAATREQASGQIKLYINGTLEATGTSSSNAISANTGVALGTVAGVPGTNTTSRFNGQMDELRMWSRVLTPCEIQNNKNCELVVASQTNLVVYYKFNQGTGEGTNTGTTTLTDASGNGYNLTLTNFALTGSSSNWVSTGAVTTGSQCSNYSAIWVGTSSTDFDAATNWTGGCEPNTVDEVSIPTTTNTPTLTAHKTIKKLSFTGTSKLKLGNFNLTTNSISGHSASAYVVTDGTGVMTIKSLPTTSATTFPIGATTSSYDPVTIQPSTSRDFAVKVKVTASKNDFTGGIFNFAKVAPRQWDITPSANAGSTALTLKNGGTTYTPTKPRIGHYNATSSKWEELTATHSSGIWTSTTSSFSPFGVGDESGFIEVVLPIELTSFTGKHTEGGNLLTWTTANEVNNKGFEVERRLGNSQQATGDSWETLGFITAKNKSSSYQFLDVTPPSEAGGAYYRLRQIDNDGKETLSKVVSVSRNSSTKLEVYPNPVSNTLTIETDFVIARNEANDYQILNLLGQQVMNGKTTQRIDVSALPEGTYFLKVGVEQVKFVKQ